MDIDSEFEIIKETMDSIHFYIVHIFDADLRSLSSFDVHTDNEFEITGQQR